MADYYSVLASAVSTLDKNTVEARQALYDRARTTILSHLHKKEPPASELEIMRAQRALAAAIHRVEDEASQKQIQNRTPDVETETNPVPKVEGLTKKLLRGLGFFAIWWIIVGLLELLHGLAAGIHILPYPGKGIMGAVDWSIIALSTIATFGLYVRSRIRRRDAAAVSRVENKASQKQTQDPAPNAEAVLSSVREAAKTLPVVRRAPIWPVLIAPVAALVYYLSAKIAFVVDVGGFGPDDIIEARWGSYWLYRAVMEIVSIGIGTFIAAGLARERERLAGLIGGISIALVIVTLNISIEGRDYWSNQVGFMIADGLLIIGAPLIGFALANLAREMNGLFRVGFAGLSYLHLVWLWLLVFWYVTGLIGPTITLIKHDFGGHTFWLYRIFPLIGMMLWLLPGCYGLALLSGHKGQDRRPLIRNMLGVGVLLFPVVAFILFNFALAMYSHEQ
jgi:hypothetical protein